MAMVRRRVAARVLMVPTRALYSGDAAVHASAGVKVWEGIEAAYVRR